MRQTYLTDNGYGDQGGSLCGTVEIPGLISPSDARWGWRIYFRELTRQGPLNEETLFKKAGYWLLSAAEKHTKQLSVYSALETAGYLSPEAILAEGNPEKGHSGNGGGRFWAIMQKARYGNEKSGRLYRLAEYWTEYGIGPEIMNDIGNGYLRGSELRAELVRNADGMAEKVASCFLNSCGYLEFVPVDIYMLRHLHRIGTISAKGKLFQIPDYKTNGGLSGKSYLDAEKRIADISRAAGLPPAVGQASLWKAYSRNSREYLNGPAVPGPSEQKGLEWF